MDIKKSYQYILGKVIYALKRLGIESMFYPPSDIALAMNQKKISGNAQKRGKKFILHHGTILYDLDLAKIARYLRVPKDVPSYRRGRSHIDFVENVQIEGKAIKDALANIFSAGQRSKYLDNEEEECLQSFLNTREITVPF